MRSNSPKLTRLVDRVRPRGGAAARLAGSRGRRGHSRPEEPVGEVRDPAVRRAPRRRQLYGIGASVVRMDGAVYFVPDYAAHTPVANKILNKRYVSPRLHHLVDTVMARRPGSMVHAGTFFGDMLPSFSKKTPGVVYAFEPVMENYLFARTTIDENKLSNVMLFHAGLGTHNDFADIETRNPKRHRGGAAHIITDPSKPQFQPQRIPLLFIDQFAIERLSLIQLDVEGFELPVLQGALETIRAHSPVIVVEDKRDKCVEFMKEIGYVQTARLGLDYVYMTPDTADEFGEI